MKRLPSYRGFTIVELLVVIVVIGVLAAITVVSYGGINSKAVVASLQSDLSNASKQFKLYYAENGSYPTTLVSNCPTAPVSDSKYCVKTSGTNTYSDYMGTPSSFYVMSKNGTTCYDIDSDSPPAINPSCIAPYVVVGSQIWHKFNLNVGTRINGAIDQTNNSTIEKYCYNDLESNCTTYGGFYLWDEMMQYTTTEGTQGICPAGSHIPSDNDWKILEVALGMTQAQADGTGNRGTDQGTKLKAGGSSGLNIPLAGNRYNGSFVNLSQHAFLWSSSGGTNNWWYRDLVTGSIVNRTAGGWAAGLSVRCLKN